jgi:large subunit ribosomal protein L22
MSTSEPEKPKRRRRKKNEDVETPEVTSEIGAELDPSAADEQAEQAASDVVLEADAEAEGEPATVDEPIAEETDEAPEPVAAPAVSQAEAGDEPASTGRAASGGRATRGSSRKPAARTRSQRGARDPDVAPPIVRAHAKYVRSSARKARLVCDHIRGKSVEEARAILAHTPRAVAQDWSKLLESAVANAEHNHELVGEDLVIKAVHADEGPTIKRFRPRAMGRATSIRKRTSHLTILLTPKL